MNPNTLTDEEVTLFNESLDTLIDEFGLGTWERGYAVAGMLRTKAELMEMEIGDDMSLPDR